MILAGMSRPKHDFGGGNQLEDGCGHLAPTIYGPKTHNMYSIHA